MIRRVLLSVFVVAGLSGCAAMNNLTSEVSTFSQWPADRKPTTYAFERLPSQAAQPERTARLEEAARPAIEAAGFKAAADPASADVTVQVGARVSASDPYPWADPFWIRGGLFYGRGYWRGAWFGGYPPSPTYAREVALLFRDRQSGQPLYEARASNDGSSPSMDSLLPAMFEAALVDFPKTGVNPRRVVTQITKR